MLEVNSDFGPGEFEALRAAAELSGRPLSVLLLQVDNAPELLARHSRRRSTARATPRLACQRPGRCRPIGVMLGLDATVNPFRTNPAYLDIAHLPLAERAARMRNDDALRQALVTDRPHDTRTAHGWTTP